MGKSRKCEIRNLQIVAITETQRFPYDHQLCFLGPGRQLPGLLRWISLKLQYCYEKQLLRAARHSEVQTNELYDQYSTC